MAAAPAAFGAPAGARDREGAARRNRHGWIALSRGFIYHRLLLDHRGAPSHQLRVFFWKSTVRQCKTDPGRRRERSVACARAAPMGQGVGRVWRPPAPRVERARPPFSGEFWRFGPDKGTSIVFGQATRAAGASAARVVDVVSAVRATHSALHFSRLRARSRHSQVWRRLRRRGGRRAAGAAERRRQ